ncbi:MAG: cytochrome ubiquinol oxidase subunit I [Cellulomonadaceae bacterium]|nr:cytochrome ubiquinol oxidase subunit I [Cellulomonadaceae bacterium]
MEALDLARWQFGITTVYHFFFVPLTISLAPLVAIMQTFWFVTKKDHWLKLTKFFGKLLMINFSLGLVTGIVQEFQFGMTWSEYSRFVGDVFGAPLAMEALAAFFLESVFLGLWIFGWDRLSKRLHLMAIWLFAIGVNLSAFFILAANSWMQHPVGTRFENGRAEMDSIWTVLGNELLLKGAFPHTITAAFVVGGTFVMGIAAWWMIRLARSRTPENVEKARTVYRPAVVFGAVVTIIAGLGLLYSGDQMGQLMFREQPGKMAAAEAVCETTDGAPFTIAAFGPLVGAECDQLTRVIEVPGMASFLSTRDWNAPFPGVQNVQADHVAKYGHVDDVGNAVTYTPDLMINFWSFRLMIGLAIFSAALAVIGLLAVRKGKVTESKWLKRLALWAIPMPFLACSFGWIFTEMGRQPWLVSPNPTGIDEIRLLTSRGVSTSVPGGIVLTSMILFTLIYAVLAVAWWILIHRYANEGVLDTVHDVSPEGRAAAGGSSGGSDEPDGPLSFAY